MGESTIRGQRIDWQSIAASVAGSAAGNAAGDAAGRKLYDYRTAREQRQAASASAKSQTEAQQRTAAQRKQASKQALKQHDRMGAHTAAVKGRARHGLFAGARQLPVTAVGDVSAIHASSSHHSVVADTGSMVLADMVNDVKSFMSHPGESTVGYLEGIIVGVRQALLHPDAISLGLAFKALDFAEANRLGREQMAARGIASVLDDPATILTLGAGSAAAALSRFGVMAAEAGVVGAEAGVVGAEAGVIDAAANRLQLEKLKTQYRQQATWVNPSEINHPKLHKIVKNLYRENAKVGSGSTADAARVEIANPAIKVGGAQHVEKAQNYIRAIDTILKQDVLTPHEEMIAENIRLDLLDAIGNKLWYSQTNTPKMF